MHISCPKFPSVLDFTTGNERAGGSSLARVRTSSFKSLDNLLSADDFTEDDVLAVQPGAGNSGNEELRTVGVLTSVSHGEQERFGVLVDEVFISEFFTINGLATSAVVVSEITTLDHEVRDDSVESGSCIAEALFTSAESAEVFSSLGNIVVELEDDALGSSVADSDVEVDLDHLYFFW